MADLPWHFCVRLATFKLSVAELLNRGCSCWSKTGTFDTDQGRENLLENLTVKALTAMISLILGLCGHW